MRLLRLAPLLPLGLVAACAAPIFPQPPAPAPAAAAPTPAGPDLPEQVLAVAAPGQNLATARKLEDGCYWYMHDGPVESTLIPLRTAQGNPICVQ